MKRANKQIHQEDSDDDSDSDADDSSSDDEDEIGNSEEVKGGDEPTHDANGKANGRGKNGEEEMSDEEQPNSQNVNQDDLDSSEDEYEN